MIKAIIIDDEQSAIDSFKTLLNDYDDIRIKGEATTFEYAIKLFKETEPNLIFLDIDLGNKVTGFDLLEKIDYSGVQIIFVTAFDKFAIKAFEFSALDYLVKPVDPDRLAQAIDKYRDQTSTINIEHKVSRLL